MSSAPVPSSRSSRQWPQRVDRVRLLYLYPSDLSDALVDAICSTGVPYFDLSLQHVSKPLLRRMRRWGDGDRFLRRITAIRARQPDAAFRSNFIVGYPGETEHDHDELLRFVEAAQLDWCGFFAFSREAGTYAADLDRPGARAAWSTERLTELTELQDTITASRRDALIGQTVEVLVDAVGVGRSHREAPEIDGVVHVRHDLRVGEFADVCDRRRAGSRSGRRRGDASCPRAQRGRVMVDPSALATWANAVTVGRLLLSPLMFWIIPETTTVRGSPGRCGSCSASATPSTATSPDGTGTTRSGAFLDPLGRQGARARGDVHARAQRHVLDRPGRHHRRAGVRDQHVPHGGRLSRDQRAGQSDGEEQDAGPAAGRRVRPLAAHRHQRERGCGTASSGWPSCSPSSAGGSTSRAPSSPAPRR